VLNATLWIALGLMLAGWAQAALGVILASVTGLAGLAREGMRAGWGRGFLALAAGAVFGLLRIADGRASTDVGLPDGAVLAALALLAILAGAVLSPLLRRPTDFPALFAGLGCALVPPALSRLAGETASLSTLDVRLAFRLVDGPLGLPGAVTAAALQPALPFLALLAGLAYTLTRTRPEQAGTFATGLAGAVAGQATAAALVFSISVSTADGTAAAALGLLVRLIGEVNSLFLGSALMLGLGGAVRRRAARSRHPAASAR
jgi:hypothetical protein